MYLSSCLHIKRLLVSQSTTDPIAPYFFCSHCKTMSHDDQKCSNSSCKNSKGFHENPNAFVRLPLRTQLENILSQHPSSYFENRLQNICDYSSDICRSDLYKYVAKQEENSFITLIMNVDGIEIAKSSKSSLWIITFVVNEFKKRERFQLQNVLVGGIGGGKSKPTRKPR